MIGWNTKVSEWADVIKSFGGCNDMVQLGLSTLYTWMDEVMKINGGQEPTIGELFDFVSKSNEYDNVVDYFIFWVSCNTGSLVQFEESWREEVLKIVKDPKMALKIYMKSPYITDKEDEILKSKFIVDGVHLFPQIEKELSDGTIIRAKNWAETVGLGDLSELGQYVKTNNPEAIPMFDNEFNL
jgi:hypothetical protein